MERPAGNRWRGTEMVDSVGVFPAIGPTARRPSKGNFRRAARARQSTAIRRSDQRRLLRSQKRILRQRIAFRAILRHAGFRTAETDGGGFLSPQHEAMGATHLMMVFHRAAVALMVAVLWGGTIMDLHAAGFCDLTTTVIRATIPRQRAGIQADEHAKDHE